MCCKTPVLSNTPQFLSEKIIKCKLTKELSNYKNFKKLKKLPSIAMWLKSQADSIRITSLSECNNSTNVVVPISDNTSLLALSN